MKKILLVVVIAAAFFSCTDTGAYDPNDGNTAAATQIFDLNARPVGNNTDIIDTLSSFESTEVEAFFPGK
ncbi:MAG TPA: hypothetical protein DCO79_08880 [Spirochaeta sp.]|nr:hypothetical protein [Spirochaeta sp.]